MVIAMASLAQNDHKFSLAIQTCSALDTGVDDVGKSDLRSAFKNFYASTVGDAVIVAWVGRRDLIRLRGQI